MWEAIGLPFLLHNSVLSGRNIFQLQRNIATLMAQVGKEKQRFMSDGSGVGGGCRWAQAPADI